MISTIISKLHTDGDTPPSPVLSAAGSSPTAGESVAGTVKHQPHEFARDSLSMSSNSDDEEKRVADSDSYAVENLPDKHNAGSGHGSVEDLAEKSASNSENGRIENVANQGETEIPVGYEDTSTYLPMPCGAQCECADQSTITNSH